MESNGDPGPPERVRPTLVEYNTLRRVPEKIPWTVFALIFVELVERISYYGTTQVYSNFLAQYRPGTNTGAAVDPHTKDAQPGALGLGQQTAQTILLLNAMWTYLVPVAGIYIADVYLGRYKTIAWAFAISVIGHMLVVASAAPNWLERDAGKTITLPMFLTGIIVMGAGVSSFRPNISPLVSEQIPDTGTHVELTKNGERVIVDPSLTRSRVYSWYYFLINFGSVVGGLTMSYAERYVGFFLAFLLPTILVICTLPVFFYGHNRYIKNPREGNVLVPAGKLICFGLKGRWSFNPILMWKKLHDGTFWAVIKPSHLGSSKPEWMTFDDAWVDDLREAIKACSVLWWLPFYWLCFNQMGNNLVVQVSTMALHGVPNDFFYNLEPFGLMILAPLLDMIIYPFLHKHNIKFTPIKRITVGFFFSSAAMVYAAVVQHYIYKTSPCGTMTHTLFLHGHIICRSTLPASLASTAYLLISVSEALACVTSLIYVFERVPRRMRNLVTTILYLVSGVSALLGTALLPLSRDPYLVWNYGVTAALCFVGGCLFWVVWRGGDQLGVEGDEKEFSAGMGTRVQAAVWREMGVEMVTRERERALGLGPIGRPSMRAVRADRQRLAAECGRQ
ncbi:Ptr2 peptide transporter [Lophiostoma macrostomum CBS 122681]|uniref:Ptr2 peptide transporter n=1 Tax=Lophiostoma macrostomum CBS 122681 TaxID=1314788 RepID=A0A6A6T2P1_9PLEO|nr:Ptr2 peptide transporter [Lophiostoma macrostomum CBS 122681]